MSTSSPSIPATDLCPHFGECGGCASQDVSYADQLQHKSDWLGELFSEFWDQHIPVAPSPLEWYYRNKVDFNFAGKQYDEPPPKDFIRETFLGFNKPGKWYWPLDIQECRIGPKPATPLLTHVRAWMKKNQLRAYDPRSKQGFLRVLLVREGKRTGQLMVVLVTHEGEFDREGFVRAVHEAHPATSIYHAIYRGSAQGAFADELHLLDGKPYIEEELQIPTAKDTRTLKFRISPLSFFQTNTLGTEVLYGKIRAWVEDKAPEIIYDLYGGSGGIAFSCADLATTIRSVENVPEASADGEVNAVENGIDNVFFTTEKVKNYLIDVLNNGGMESNSVAIVDPPRSGMTPKALRRLLESAPPHILYVSCKPTVFVKEMPQILESYKIEGLESIDMFPHTPHVEVLASFRRRES